MAATVHGSERRKPWPSNPAEAKTVEWFTS